jgi:hypothetical protein
MANALLAPDRDNFHRSQLAYTAMAALRHKGMDDSEIAAVESLIHPSFEALLATPARTPEELAGKAEAIVSEFTPLDVPVNLLSILAAELRGLVQ